MFPGNRKQILFLVDRIRKIFGDTKTIWMYTGYRIDQIIDDPILSYIDVVVDGPYIQEQRDITRQWVGSDNQIVYRKNSRGKWIPDEKKYTVEKEQSCACRN